MPKNKEKKEQKPSLKNWSPPKNSKVVKIAPPEKRPQIPEDFAAEKIDKYEKDGFNLYISQTRKFPVSTSQHNRNQCDEINRYYNEVGFSDFKYLSIKELHLRQVKKNNRAKREKQLQQQQVNLSEWSPPENQELVKIAPPEKRQQIPEDFTPEKIDNYENGGFNLLRDQTIKFPTNVSQHHIDQWEKINRYYDEVVFKDFPYLSIKELHGRQTLKNNENKQNKKKPQTTLFEWFPPENQEFVKMAPDGQEQKIPRSITKKKIISFETEAYNLMLRELRKFPRNVSPNNDEQRLKIKKFFKEHRFKKFPYLPIAKLQQRRNQNYNSGRPQPKKKPPQITQEKWSPKAEPKLVKITTRAELPSHISDKDLQFYKKKALALLKIELEKFPPGSNEHHNKQRIAIKAYYEEHGFANFPFETIAKLKHLKVTENKREEQKKTNPAQSPEKSYSPENPTLTKKIKEASGISTEHSSQSPKPPHFESPNDYGIAKSDHNIDELNLEVLNTLLSKEEEQETACNGDGEAFNLEFLDTLLPKNDNQETTSNSGTDELNWESLDTLLSEDGEQTHIVDSDTVALNWESLDKPLSEEEEQETTCNGDKEAFNLEFLDTLLPKNDNQETTSNSGTDELNWESLDTLLSKDGEQAHIADSDTVALNWESLDTLLSKDGDIEDIGELKLDVLETPLSEDHKQGNDAMDVAIDELGLEVLKTPLSVDEEPEHNIMDGNTQNAKFDLSKLANTSPSDLLFLHGSLPEEEIPDTPLNMEYPNSEDALNTRDYMEGFKRSGILPEIKLQENSKKRSQSHEEIYDQNNVPTPKRRRPNHKTP